MEFYNNKPVIYFDIDESIESKSGMNFTSFVDNPATQTMWLAYENVSTTLIPQAYKVSSTEEQCITAPIMLADTPIERYDKAIGTYYSVFTPASIKKMMKKYFMQNKINNINEMHDGYRVVDNVYMVESYIINDTVKSLAFPEAKDGSWIGTYYIADTQYWNDNIKTGKFKGISLEGDFIATTEEVKYSQIEKILANNELSDTEIFNLIKNIL